MLYLLIPPLYAPASCNNTIRHLLLQQLGLHQLDIIIRSLHRLDMAINRQRQRQLNVGNLFSIQ